MGRRADREQRAFEQALRIFAVTFGKKLQGLAHSLGRAGETFAIWIFAETHEHFTNEIFKAGAGHGAWLCRWFHGDGFSCCIS